MRVVDPHPCIICGETTTNLKFCGSACRSKVGSSTAVRPCTVCRRRTTAVGGICRACQAEQTRTVNRITTRRCPICGDEYEPQSLRQQTCGAMSCRMINRSEQAIARSQAAADQAVVHHLAVQAVARWRDQRAAGQKFIVEQAPAGFPVGRWTGTTS